MNPSPGPFPPRAASSRRAGWRRHGLLTVPWTFLLLGTRLAAAPAAAAAPEQDPATSMAAAGRHVFAQHCQTCHGRRGNGRGDLARGMLPKPRDFTLGLFKFRSTPSGSLPTDDDLRRTIRGGLAGTAMPAFTALPERDLRAVIEFLKTLSPRWTQTAPGTARTPIPIPAPPAWFESAEARILHARDGRAVFQRTCAPCHGPEGHGDGPSAASLLDVRGEPCPPRNLVSGPLRRGPRPEDLFRTLLTGLDGTPMPSFAEAMSDAERWDLVAFVLGQRPAAVLTNP